MPAIKDEYRAVTDLIICPGIGIDEPLCTNCRYAKAHTEGIGGDVNFVRCALHDVRMSRQELCADYVPAPDLDEIKELATVFGRYGLG